MVADLVTVRMEALGLKKIILFLVKPMLSDENYSLVVVTPVYEDTKASSLLFKNLGDLYPNQVFIVAVDDGSVHQPVNTESIESAGLRGVVIQLKCNVGHQCAIAIGLNYVSDQFPDLPNVVIMDSDGEDDPESIHRLLKSLDSPNIDIVVAGRKSRVESMQFRLFYIVYKFLFYLLAGKKISFGNFMALKPPAVKRLIAMPELTIHVAACALKSKLRILECPLDRGARYAGQSKMNFVGLALHGFKGLMVFAEDVLVRVGIACTFIAFFSILGGITAIALKTFGFATPGWFSVALGILFLVFIQTGTLTLMTLMLTGVVKSGANTPIVYEDFIRCVLHTKE